MRIGQRVRQFGSGKLGTVCGEDTEINVMVRWDGDDEDRLARLDLMEEIE